MRRPLADLSLAFALLAAAELEVLLDGLSPICAGLAAVATLPLAARRTAPLLSFACVAVLAPALDIALDAGWGDNANALVFLVLLACYSVAAHAPLRRSLPAALVAAASLAAMDALSDGGGDYAFLLLLVALPWLSGRGVRTYRRQTERLAELARRLELEQAANERVAVARERQRTAHETHDAIAHSVGVMTLQAGGAEEVLERDPERARSALGAIQDTGREAVRELRDVLGILRSDNGAAPPDVGTAGAPGAAAPNPRSWPAALDPALALILLAIGIASVLAADGYAGERVTAAAMQVVAPAAVLLRGRRPLAALALAMTAFAGDAILLGGDAQSPATIAAALLTTYAAAAHADRRGAAAAAVLALGVPAAVGVLVAHDDAADVLLPLAVMGIPWLSGRMVALYRRRGESLRILTARLERERAARAWMAVLEERARVAAELHDSVAHAISVMVLQAGAAEQVLDTEPGQARAALRAVQDVGRGALAELSRLLGVLEAGDDAATRAPRPGMDQLDFLLDSVRHAGLPVRLRLVGEATDLPPALDGAAYRVIQESLTNALEHAGAAPTTVTLCYTADGVRLEITDAGVRRPGPTADGRGHGLAGMRERVLRQGGGLSAGPGAGGRGFTVTAFLPYAAPPERVEA